jgi:hypothetical protein
MITTWAQLNSALPKECKRHHIHRPLLGADYNAAMQPTSTIWPTHMAPQRKRSKSRSAMHAWPIKTYGACLTLTPKRAVHEFSRLDPGPSDKKVLGSSSSGQIPPSYSYPRLGSRYNALQKRTPRTERSLQFTGTTRRSHLCVASIPFFAPRLQWRRHHGGHDNAPSIHRWWIAVCVAS